MKLMSSTQLALAMAAATSAVAQSPIPTAMPSASPELIKCWDIEFKAAGCKNQDWDCILKKNPHPYLNLGQDATVDQKFNDCIMKIPDEMAKAGQMAEFAFVSYASANGIPVNPTGSPTFSSHVPPTAMPSASPEIIKCWDISFKAHKCPSMEWECLWYPFRYPGALTEDEVDPKVGTEVSDCLQKLGIDAVRVAQEMQEYAGISNASKFGLQASGTVPLPAIPSETGAAMATITSTESRASAGASATSAEAAASATNSSGADITRVGTSASVLFAAVVSLFGVYIV